MRILGIDPGLAITGWGVIDQQSTGMRYLDHGVLTTAAHTALPERLHALDEQLQQILVRFTPAVVAVEELFFAANAKTAMVVGHARGVILARVAQHQCELREFTPLQIKLALTGFGRADKRQVGRMATVILGVRTLHGPDDAIDALAAAICAANTMVVKSK